MNPYPNQACRGVYVGIYNMYTSEESSNHCNPPLELLADDSKNRTHLRRDDIGDIGEVQWFGWVQWFDGVSYVPVRSHAIDVVESLISWACYSSCDQLLTPRVAECFSYKK